ncbi:MAG TPA: O-antigen ligase family protein [Acidimicrobiales bacterium]|nr:O-antigen ligase family protein [Acidimicrobiales bacterium]
MTSPAEVDDPDGLDLAPPPLATFDTAPKRLLIPRWMLLVGLIIAQALLARYMTQIPRLGQIQAVMILALVGYGALKRNTPLMLCIAAYLPGAEIVWRQAHVTLPYLFAPYTLTAIAVLSLITCYPSINRIGREALLYFALLIPSSLITFSIAQHGGRKLVSFALSGAAALAALTMLFSQVAIRPWLYRRLLWVMLISGVGPLSVALTAISDYIVNVGTLEFNGESNSVTSGGFGPVQVSSLMGLTVLVAVLLVLAERDVATRVIAGVVGIWSATQSLLTFSRGGMFAVAIAVAGLVVVQAWNREARRKVFALVGVSLLIGYYIIIPRLDAFTRGGLEERFSDTQTGRTTLAHNDIQIFLEHPVFGVGPGMSKYRRLPYEICELRSDRCNYEGSSHTEFTRMIAEHGSVGLAAMAILLLLAFHAIRRAGPSLAFTVVMLLWAIAQMVYANMRIAAVPFAFALAFIQIRDPNDDPVTEEPDPTLEPAIS